MPDKLTDSEIIKALECCSKDEINGLNIFTYGGVPMRSLLRYALDLINRLQAKIERLRDENKALRFSLDLCKGWEERAKAEAIKECIEKVKETSNKTELVCSGALVRTDYTISEKKLDNLLKEMVGDKE